MYLCGQKTSTALSFPLRHPDKCFVCFISLDPEAQTLVHQWHTHFKSFPTFNGTKFRLSFFHQQRGANEDNFHDSFSLPLFVQILLCIQCVTAHFCSMITAFREFVLLFFIFLSIAFWFVKQTELILHISYCLYKSVNATCVGSLKQQLQLVQLNIYILYVYTKIPRVMQ